MIDMDNGNIVNIDMPYLTSTTDWLLINVVKKVGQVSPWGS